MLVSQRKQKNLIIEDDLYKRGHSTPLLKCVTQEQADYIPRKLHEGICGLQLGV